MAVAPPAATHVVIGFVVHTRLAAVPCVGAGIIVAITRMSMAAKVVQQQQLLQ